MDKKQTLCLLLKLIPAGRITTYKILAKKLGTHPRTVGKMLNLNQRPVIVPCHRVVRSDGGIGGYAFGIKKKIALLEKEGVNIKGEKIDLNGFLFSFEGPDKL